ncbi:PREDICTED: uncharacterized protein LOC107343321 [Acropora digitifera]|uniref:uncharacterized protein LOC107343321 n=1 Tax=Acropora digitifera TaxID=70779 RepID=UPI00077A9B64|nr:PREDICTED: uncharacterized protein LOC107343321 [Acropora digitifera]
MQHRPSVINKRKSSSDSSHSGAPSSPSERAFHEMLELHQHQNILQQQQNNIVEMLVTQQKKSSLPSPRVHNFDGDPLEYGSFIRAFENIIESKTSSSSERLYYLEQFTSGDVKELVRSCQYLPPDAGYDEARRLMKKKFGDDFRVVAAYESKALSWPEVRAEDGVGLNRFSLFLMRCKNAMEGSGHLTKLEQPDTIRKLVLKLPFNMRVRWRRLVDDVVETEARAAMFADFANFVDHEARIATNPVFGRILEDARPKLDRRDARLQKRSVSKRPGELSFAAQVDSSQNSPARVATPRGSANSVGEMSYLYCNAGHALENCSSLRNRPYSERIEFLKLKGLCFELDTLLEEIREREKSAEEKIDALRNDKKAKDEKEKAAAEEIRQAAVQTMAKRKSDDNGEKPKKAKLRRSTSDAIEFLAEKSEKERELKKEE